MRTLTSPGCASSWAAGQQRFGISTRISDWSMKILVGTSGWSYKEWRGSFYPPKLATEEMLAFYASRFITVEVNNSFYRIPSEKVLAGWAAQVPPNFRFVVKASRRITHNSRLADEDGSLEYFLRAINPLGERLGPTLFQLPPTFKKDTGRLRNFLIRLPPRWMAALEFRHASWFAEEVYDLLRCHDIALVTVDEDDTEGPGSPLVVTAAWGYLRLRRSAYDSHALASWAGKIQERDWNQAYVFLKHEDGSPRGPDAAEALQRALRSPGFGDEDHDRP
jgi:uncharacterized protein YecE (DUF72 family)